MRILSAADVNEVKLALDILGIEVVGEEPALIGLLKELFDSIFGPIFLIREITKEFLDSLFGEIGEAGRAFPKDPLDKVIKRLLEASGLLGAAIGRLSDVAQSEGKNSKVASDIRVIVQSLQISRSIILSQAEFLDTVSADLTGIASEADQFQKKLATLQDQEDAQREEFEARIRQTTRTTSTI